MGSRIKPAGVGFSGQGFQNGAAGPGRAENDLSGVCWPYRSMLRFDTHTLDDPLDDLFRDLDADRNCAIRRGAPLLVGGPSTALGTPDRGATGLRWPPLCRHLDAAPGAPLQLHKP